MTVALSAKQTQLKPTSRSAGLEHQGESVLLAVLCALYACVLVRTAWLCDDAYITFRTIDNFLHGYGLTWNTHERVQAYTHPLWMFLLSGFYYFTREIYFTSLLVSMAVSLAAVIVFASKVARTWPQAILGLAVLIFSKAFMDYSTSGLENPLTYLLLALFFGVYLPDRSMTGRRLFVLSLLGSLAMVNRMDTILLLGPALLEAWWTGRTPANNSGLAPGNDHGPEPATATTAGSGPCHPPGHPQATAPQSIPVDPLRGYPNWEPSRLLEGGTSEASASGLLEGGTHGLSHAEHSMVTNNVTMAPGTQSWRSCFTLSPCHLVTLSAVLGFLPFVAWEVFSVIYYGFPFPNTAYAKLNTGIPAFDLARQGVYYLANSLRMDPLTLIVIFCAIATAMFRRGRQVMIALGIALYLAYLVKIGGDFMSGRFLAAPLLCAVIVLASMPSRPRPVVTAILMAGIVLVGWYSPAPPLRSGMDYGQRHKDWMDSHKISDERGGCYPYTGLLRASRYVSLPDHPWVEQAVRLRKYGPKVAIYGGIGFRGFFAGPDVRLIDFLALPDPLLARLPAEARPVWRIGHFRRSIPDGYVDTAASGRNQIKDPDLAAFYDKIILITRGPLFTRDRWAAIWNMNLGRYDHLIDRETCRFPYQLRTDLRQLARLSRQPPTSQSAPATQAAASLPAMLDFPGSGILVDLGELTFSPSVELTLTGNDRYEVTWLHGMQELGKQATKSVRTGSKDLVPFRLSAPDAAIQKGYDALRILPFRGTERCGLQHVRLHESGKR